VYFVDGDEGQRSEQDLASTFNAARASAIWKRVERGDSFDDRLRYPAYGIKTGLGDAIADALEIVGSGPFSRASTGSMRRSCSPRRPTRQATSATRQVARRAEARPISRVADSFDDGLVIRIFTSWNQTAAWLTQVEGLRRVPPMAQAGDYPSSLVRATPNAERTAERSPKDRASLAAKSWTVRRSPFFSRTP